MVRDSCKRDIFDNYLYMFLFIGLINQTDGAYFSDVHWSTAIKLSEYTGYQSVSILSYDVPPQSGRVTFTFEARASSDACTFRDVLVYFQHGSYPLVSPYNETYPDKFYTKREDAFNVAIKKNSGSVSYILSTPRPGPWYFASFLPKFSSDRLEPKKTGFDKSCVYGMFVMMETEGIDYVEELSMEKKHTIHLTHDSHHKANQVLYRFMLPKSAVSYTISIGGCLVAYFEGFNQTLTSICPVKMIIQSETLPSLNSQIVTNCSNQTTCTKQILSPLIDTWTYIDIAIDDGFNVSTIDFTLGFQVETCESLKLFVPKMIFKASQKSHTYHSGSAKLSQDSCMMVDELGKFTWGRQTYNTSFLIADKGVIPTPLPLQKVLVPQTLVLVTSLYIQNPKDIGGTLKMYAEVSKDIIFANATHVTVVYICLMKNSVPGGENVGSCDQGIQLVLNSTDHVSDMVYIPYPETGKWYLGLNSQCFDKKSSKPVGCPVQPEVNMDISLSGCLDSQCGRYGSCKEYISGVYIFSVCKCFAGWRGYGCTDGSEARSDQEELTAVLLLSLSNLFFLPAICLATYRRYFMEALVYLFVMFFSGFYHACDTSHLIYYCMFKYDALSYADYFGSITAFWVTMISMAELLPKMKSFGHMFGIMGVAVATEFDRHNFWVFAAPAGLAALIMMATWVVQCRKQRKVFPSKKYYLTNLLPGVILAVTGMLIFAFLETKENYKYTHSAWHMTISLSIVFLLPRRRAKAQKESREMDEVLPDTFYSDTLTEQTDVMVEA